MKYAFYVGLAGLVLAGAAWAQAPAASASAKLVAAQDAARGNNDYQAHHYLATASIAKAMGAPMAPLANTQGDAFTANQAAANLAAEAGKSGSYKEVSADQAQELANQGGLVIVAWSNPQGNGHLATVRPEGVSGDQVHAGSREPLINNVGVDVGIEGANWVFRKDAQVHYYTPSGGGN